MTCFIEGTGIREKANPYLSRRPLRSPQSRQRAEVLHVQALASGHGSHDHEEIPWACVCPVAALLPALRPPRAPPAHALQLPCAGVCPAFPLKTAAGPGLL